MANDSMELRIVLDPNLPLIRRLMRQIVRLENANAVKDSLIDQLAEINTDQTDQIAQLKSQRDAANAEIESAVTILGGVDPDPNFPIPPQSTEGQ